MRKAVLALVLVLVLASTCVAPVGSRHVLIGIMPNLTYEVLVDGVKVEGVEPEADDLGTLEFWLPPMGEGVHTVEVRPLTGYVLEVGDCGVVPID